MMKWTTRMGTEIAVRDMGDDHVRATFAMLTRRGKWVEAWRNIFALEIAKRMLDRDPYIEDRWSMLPDAISPDAVPNRRPTPVEAETRNARGKKKVSRPKGGVAKKGRTR